jgi:hypothetical protein
MTQANQSEMSRRKMAAFDWRKSLDDLPLADALLAEFSSLSSGSLQLHKQVTLHAEVPY